MTHLVLVLLVLTTAAGRSGIACPTMCTCGNYPRDVLQIPVVYYTTVSCASYSENITSQLEDTTHDLTLTNLNEAQLQTLIESLLEEEEIRLPYLAQLTITRSVVSELINLTFSGFSRLQSLNLSRNRQRQIHPDCFFNITTLQNLDLSGNIYTKIDNQPFRTLPNLELLNLSANHLSVINSNSFSGLETLKSLDLSRNNLTILNDNVFSPLMSLQYLNLSSNRLKILNEKCLINLLKLQQLDISWNRLTSVELGSLQLPSLARLLLEGNPKLGTSRELLVGTGQRLQTVDASRIGLKQVPAALTHSIRTLRLAGNSIKTVRCGDLDSYPLLQLLDFNANGLELIEDDALGRLDSLSILYLTDNNMKEIPKMLSEKLKVLHLELNGIERICAKDLQGLTSLEVLLLSDNKIKLIEEEAFNQLASLVTLDISRNPIKVLAAGCLSGPMTLQVLRLSSIAVIAPAKEVSFPLSSTEHLITLDLSGSPGLARQLLVDTAALAASRELQELDLSFTELEYIRSDLLHFLPQLRIFHILGNRINCTQLQWLAAWMRRQDEPEYKKITCANPPELWGTPLIDLQEAEISSNYNPTTAQTFVKMKKSENEIRNFKPALSREQFHRQQDDNSMTISPTRINTSEIEMQNDDNFSRRYGITTNTITPPPQSQKEVDAAPVTTSPMQSTTTVSHLETDLPLTNANEPQESLHNKLDRGSGKTEISHNLFIASKTFSSSAPHAPEKHNNKLNELFPEVPSVTTLDDVDINSNSSHEHASSMSMFSAGGDGKLGILHPGMLILAAGIVGAAAALAMVAVRCTRRRRATTHEEIEVGSLPGVTELW